MGVLVVALAGNAHQLQHSHCPLHGLQPGALGMQSHHLCNLLAYRHHRVQRCHGVLEDHCDLSAPDLAVLLFF